LRTTAKKAYVYRKFIHLAFHTNLSLMASKYSSCQSETNGSNISICVFGENRKIAKRRSFEPYGRATLISLDFERMLSRTTIAAIKAAATIEITGPSIRNLDRSRWIKINAIHKAPIHIAKKKATITNRVKATCCIVRFSGCSFILRLVNRRPANSAGLTKLHNKSNQITHRTFLNDDCQK